jgi:hypothetical protein
MLRATVLQRDGKGLLEDAPRHEAGGWLEVEALESRLVPRIAGAAKKFAESG